MIVERLRVVAAVAMLVLLIFLVGIAVHTNNDNARLDKENHVLLNEVHADEQTEKARRDQSVKDTHSIMAKLGIPIPATTEPPAP